MSQYSPAITYTLNWEDPRREYKIVPDKGGYALAGINSAAWPTDFKQISEAPQSMRSQLVYYFYQKNHWNKMRIGGLESQELANRVFDMGVNSYITTSIKLLQRSLIQLNCFMHEDGIFGPETMEAANAQDQERLIAVFKNIRFNFYKKIVDDHPEDARYLNAWEKRALA